MSTKKKTKQLKRICKYVKKKKENKIKCFEIFCECVKLNFKQNIYQMALFIFVFSKFKKENKSVKRMEENEKNGIELETSYDEALPIIR